MIRALYTAASGLVTGMRQQEVVANNLANVQTPGYKGETSATSAFERIVAWKIGNAPVPVPMQLNRRLGAVGTGAYESLRASDFTDGNVTATTLPLDMSISGPGFFAVQVDGNVQYTRDGHFGLDAQRRIVASDGSPVLDVNRQPIVVSSQNVLVLPDGQVRVDDEPVATLLMVDIDPASAVRARGSRFVLPPGVTPALLNGAEGTVIRQGFLEEANVDMTEAATDLISTQRAFEGSQRVFTTIDETLETAVRDIGRVG